MEGMIFQTRSSAPAGRNQSLLQPESRHCFVKISSR